MISKNNNQQNEPNRLSLLKLLQTEMLENVKWCWSNPQIPTLQYKSIQTIDFYRNFVHKNSPCLIDQLPCCEWNADDNNTGNWNWNNIIKHSKKNKVRVNVTPNGRGDAVICDNNNNKLIC